MRKKRYYLYMSEQEIKQNFSKNLILLRKAKGLTQLALAEKINYSDKSISKWERGDVLPDIVTFRMVADFFEVSVDDLISTPSEPKVVKRGNRVIITLLSCVGAFLCAFLVDRLMDVWGASEKSWLAYIYVLPVTGILWVIFSSIWFSLRARFISVSYLVWTSGLALYLTMYQFVYVNLWFLFIVCAFGEVLIILGFILMARKAKMKNSIKED
jgi:transcriptional regulator with XRE-family HTH domain